MTIQTPVKTVTEQQSIINERVEVLLEQTAADGYMFHKPRVVDTYQYLKDTLPHEPVEYALDIIQKFSPIIYECMVELSKTDSYLMEELELADDVVFVAGIDGTSVCHTLMLSNGEFSYSLERPEISDMAVFMNEDTYRRVMTGETDAMDAFMDGEVNLEGSVTAGVHLRAIFETLCDEFGFKIIDFG
jgi:putative sterol carrier protein